MSAPQKLTKKQKKGVAFRERKGKHVPKDSLEDNDVPILEEQDAADIEIPAVENTEVEKKTSKGKGKAKAKDGGEPEVGKKRKRQDDEEGVTVENDAKVADAAPKSKKKKTVKSKDKDSKQRFILFVGNLKYTTSLEDIQTHFAACDPPPSVRLLTPKSVVGRPIAKSKGCAFLEFTHRNALQQALKLHQSQLDGRMINVELTAGGGGKSDTRIQKLKDRNKGLHTQRKEKLEQQAKDGEAVSTTLPRPQRFSTTSGVDQAPRTKRTWTIEDNMDAGETHRGGQKHRTARGKKGGAASKPWGTGVNAIPVG